MKMVQQESGALQQQYSGKPAPATAEPSAAGEKGPKPECPEDLKWIVKMIKMGVPKSGVMLKMGIKKIANPEKKYQDAVA